MTDDPKPPRRPLRRIRSLLKQLLAVDAELTDLTEVEEDEREEERKAAIERRKFLIGKAVLERVQRRLRLIPWLQGVLDSNLTRAQDRVLFQLDGGPLISQEEWPGWPDHTQRAEASVAARPPMSPRRRRARITFLQDRRKTIVQELGALQKKDAPQREAKNYQRRVVVGATLLMLALRQHGVMRWLRKLLDVGLSEPRDRQMFELAGDEPLVPEEEWLALQVTKPQAAKKQRSDGPAAADPPARTARSTSRSANRSGRAESPKAASVVRSREPESAGNEATAPEGQDPIPGWRPCRIPDQNASDSEDGQRKTVWGAVLKGRAAVAALPTDLRGKEINVTDSAERSWTSVVTEVVRRDEGSITVRNSGRPGWDGEPSPGSKTPSHRRPDVRAGAGDGAPLGQTAADCGRTSPGASTRISSSRSGPNLEASDGKSRTPTHARK